MWKLSKSCTSDSCVYKSTPCLMLLILLSLAPKSATAAEISVSGGPAVYDLAAIGTTFSPALRITQPLAPWVRVEAAVTIAFPKPRDESRYVLYQPEIGCLLAWPRQGWQPYIGTAVGAAGFDDKHSGPDWEFALSGAIGAFIPIGHRFYLRPDFRIRGIGNELSASITDFSLGLVIKL